MTKRFPTAVILAGLLTWTASAEAPVYRPMIELTAVDLPANSWGGFFYPTATQARELSSGLFEATYWGFALLSDLIIRPERTVLNLGLRTLLSFPLVWWGTELPVPYGTWLHEEYHVSALRYGGATSINGNSFTRWDGTVYGLSDAELIDLKASDPAALVRAQEAGIEANNHLVLTEVKRDFYRREAVSKPLLYLYYAYYNWNYFRLSIGELGDGITQAIVEHEGDVPEDRDFTGLDPLGWIYDLSRPDEPYDARGPHPGGVGIQRAVPWSRLTPREQGYLQLQQTLSLLNAVDPFAFFLHHVGGPGWKANLLLQHTPTSFGYTVDVDVLLKVGGVGLYASQKNQWNGERWFPGLEIELVDLPLLDWLTISPRLVGWLQPQAQSFATTAAQAGLLASARADTAFTPNIGAFVDVGYKTAGWVMGTMSLGPSFFGRAGLWARL